MPNSRKEYDDNPVYYVYSLGNPETNQPFYIGKGTRYRCYQHLKDTMETTHNKRLTGHIQKLRQRGIEEEVEDLTLYCKERGLTRSKMYEVASGARKQHKGYKCRKKNS